MRRRRRALLACLAAALLTACEIEDDLEIRADGSGTYRARVVVERVVSPVYHQIRAEAERQGFRIIEEGKTFTTRFMVLQKDFTDVRTLSGPQSSFDLKIEQQSFRRRYRLRATLGSVAGASFERRFTITMPADVVSASAGGFDGRRVTWYCSNGGTIDITAEAVHVPVRPWHLAVVVFGLAVVAAVTTFLLRRRRVAVVAPAAAVVSTGPSCRTCKASLPTAAHFCPSCGDIV